MESMNKTVNLLVIMFVVFLFGCNQAEYMDYTDTQIPIEHAGVQFSAVGGQKEITVNSDESYTVVSDQTWCKTTINGKTVAVVVEPNKTISGRTALLTMRSGKRVNYIPVTQTSAVISLEQSTYEVADEQDTVYVKYKCDFPVSIMPSVDWIKSSVDHDRQEIRLIVSEESSRTRTATIKAYADGGNSTPLAVAEIIIRQNFLHYDDFIGPYTMRYSPYPAVPVQISSLDVSLVAGVSGKSYFLKGILADDDLGNIVVQYDALSGTLSFSGSKIVAAQDVGSSDFWWAPYQRQGTSYYVTPTNAYGMVSVDHNLSRRLSFTLENDGLRPGFTTVGFILRKYVGTTNKGNVAGKDKQSMYMYPIFERK
jgi:hypothetical protein